MTGPKLATQWGMGRLFSVFRARVLRCAVGLLVWAMASSLGGAAEAKGRPNVLFILCDDLRWNAMGCAGHSALKTPHIDRLAAEGVRFANTFCTTSLCSPSRASILTGRYAHAHGVRDNFTELPPQ